MGEAFKRRRAAAFEHQRSRAYQALVDQDLIRASRATEVRFEVTTRLSNSTTGLALGSHCLVRERGGEYEVVHGNLVVAQLPQEACDAIVACKQAAPRLNGVTPCRVSRLGAFGAVSLELDLGEDDGS